MNLLGIGSAQPVDTEDWRNLARKRLPRMIFDYLEGGAGDEAGLQHNRDALRRVRLLPSRLVDVSRREQGGTLFGVPRRSPLMIAPTGLNGVLWPKGDIALARAAAQHGIPFALSTASNATMEEVAGEAGGNLWFQLYVLQRGLADSLVQRALKAGYKGLILTVDVAVNGLRKRDLRNGFSMPFRYTPRVLADVLIHPRWLFHVLASGMPQMRNVQTSAVGDMAAQAALIRREMDATFSWDDLRRLRSQWPHKLLVKGVLSVDDAQRCIECGADGVILSNHGGRQMEDLCSPVEMLPEVAQAVSQPVMADSGIRSGSDVLKCLALGADSVLLGRAVLYGLAAAGERGAAAAIASIQEDIDRGLALIGCPGTSLLGRRYLAATGGQHGEAGTV
jgi:(S)-mandelate dehydrogenase